MNHNEINVWGEHKAVIHRKSGEKKVIYDGRNSFVRLRERMREHLHNPSVRYGLDNLFDSDFDGGNGTDGIMVYDSGSSMKHPPGYIAMATELTGNSTYEKTWTGTFTNQASYWEGTADRYVPDGVVTLDRAILINDQVEKLTPLAQVSYSPEELNDGDTLSVEWRIVLHINPSS